MVDTLVPKAWFEKPDPSQHRFDRLDEIDRAIEAGREAARRRRRARCPYAQDSDLRWYWDRGYQEVQKERERSDSDAA